MADVKKVLDGWKRCQECTGFTSKAYRECEYTVGIYCGKDALIRDTIELIQDQDALLKDAYAALAAR